MEDILKKIIDLDKQARESKIKSNQLKLESEQKINDLKKLKKTEFLNKAKLEIKEKEKDEKIKAYIKISAIEGVNKKKIEKISKIYSENKENWIKSIVEKVIQS